jgi:hypothetical protein
MKPNPKGINIILNILKGAQFEFLPRAPFYIDTPMLTQPSECCPKTHTQFQDQFNAILPFMAWSPKWIFPIVFN